MRLGLVVVEPHPELAGDLEQSLCLAGFDAESCGTLDQAEHLIETRSPRAALLDVSDEVGLARLRAVAQRRPELRIIAMDAERLPGRGAIARRAGASHYLRKPFRIAELEAALAASAAPIASPNPAGCGRASLPTRSPRMRRLLEALEDAALTDATVLLSGENGVGKSDLARRIHAASRRRAGRLTRVVCADGAGPFAGPGMGAALAAPDTREGTLLLEEISDLSPDAQGEVLEWLANAKGEARPRIVATSSADLPAEVRAGRLRAELFYRLDVISLHVPALRERSEDLGDLAREQLRRLAEAHERTPPRLSQRGAQRLARHPFPGNLRELENWMRRALFLSPGGELPGAELDVDQLLDSDGKPAPPRGQAGETLNLRELERRAIERSLVENDGNRTHAARALGISVRTLRNKLRLYQG